MATGGQPLAEDNIRSTSIQHWASLNHWRSQRLEPSQGYQRLDLSTVGAIRLQCNSAMGNSQPLEVSMAGALTGLSTAGPLNSGSNFASIQFSIGQLSATGGLNGWSPHRALNSRTSQQWELLGMKQPVNSRLPRIRQAPSSVFF